MVGQRKSFYKNWIVPIESEAIHIFGLAEDCVPLKQELKLLVWNVYKGQLAAWELDFDRLSAKFDFLMLQEVYLSSDHSRVHFLPSKLRAIFARSFTYINKQFSTGVLTSARFRELDSMILHSQVKEPITQTPKTSLITTYSLGQDSQQKILFINSHLINFRGLKAFKDQLIPIFKKVDAHPGPVIFAGDFNTWSKSRMQLLLKLAAEHSLEHVELANDDRVLDYDHIFVRGVEIIEAKVLGEIESSDHKPMSLIFKIN